MSRPNFDAENHDHIVATVLPYMCQKHDSEASTIRDFTEDESRGLYVDQLPLLMNHNDGTEDPHTGDRRPLDIVGSVMASANRGPHMKILASIDPSMDPPEEVSALYSSNAVLNGIYVSVSLSNIVEGKTRASDSQLVWVKSPIEISLCKVGRRYGSNIEQYCPGRKTLERLAEHAPEDLSTLVKLHKYDQELIASGVSAPEGSRDYIDALVNLSKKRLERAIDTNNLLTHPPPVPRSQVSASRLLNTHKEQASEKSHMDSVGTENAQHDSGDQEAREQSAQTLSSTTDSSAKEDEVGKDNADQSSSSSAGAAKSATEFDASNAKQMAALAVQAKEAERAAQKELNELKKELEDGRKAKEELDTIKKERGEKRKREFETIVKSYQQKAASGGIPRQEIDEQISCAREIFSEKPDLGKSVMDNALRLSIRASANYEETELKKVHQMAEEASRIDSKYFEGISNKLKALQEDTKPFSRSFTRNSGADSMESSLDKRFKRKRVPVKEEEEEEEEEVKDPVWKRTNNVADNSPDPVKEKSAPQLWVRASDAYNDYDAAGVFMQQVKELGRYPSISEVQYNTRLVPTGKMQASADGGEEPVMTRRNMRDGPACIEPANFAPRWNNTLNSCLLNPQFAVRNAPTGLMKKRSGVMAQTHFEKHVNIGHGDEEFYH